ncbi:hypothetical protein JAAARDRAFT_34492 [Jaapia argillacea MUCL 33604]|uniref:AB hydrolase-1 domain-containing protein n=1 Tax=Jaapia argillacea MUCL 33604 TaxID=933084 RepID=A0A067PV08_9AGAM|nr:hypothetical protein JAAARDRAFT_34492 [Jaapia argillacea MUCL 33604]
MTWNLPAGVSSRFVLVNDLKMHVLEGGIAGDGVEGDGKQRPMILLLHGFPELSYSWRKIIIPLAIVGYRVIAPDQRGYGATQCANLEDSETPTIRYEDDISPFRMLNLVKDVVALVYALGYTSVEAIVGHDFGSAVAAHCALIRPDLFRSVVLMSAPYPGPPTLPFDILATSSDSSVSQPPSSLAPRVDAQLAELHPPRKHYTTYLSTSSANFDMHNAPQGLQAFLRAYFHMKSVDWDGNNPYPLSSPTASSLAVMPHYYIMPLGETMPEVVARHAPLAEEIETNHWLTDDELRAYVSTYSTTGFQGGLNWYRCMTSLSPSYTSELAVFSGKTIEVPAMYIAGGKDWGIYQNPGAVERMRDVVCQKMDEEDFVLIHGAGHWVQQEKPEDVVYHILRFLKKAK